MFIIGDKVKFIMGGLTFISIITHKSEKLYNINVIDIKISENYPKKNWTNEMLEKTKRNISEFFNVHEENLKLFEDEINNKFKKFTITI
jgi:transposase-like protein